MLGVKIIQFVLQREKVDVIVDKGPECSHVMTSSTPLTNMHGVGQCVEAVNLLLKLY